MRQSCRPKTKSGLGLSMDYTEDKNRLNEKRTELVRIATEALNPSDSKIAARIVDSFCSLSPPLEPPVFIEMITIHSQGARGGRSRKPGNLWLNWRKFASDFGDLSLTVASVAVEPKLIPLAALSIWNKIWSHSSIELTREHATVLYAMWQARNNENKLTETDAFQKSGLMFQLNGWPALAQQQFDSIIEDLEQIKCIEKDSSDGTIWLRECVKKIYT